MSKNSQSYFHFNDANIQKVSDIFIQNSKSTGHYNDFDFYDAQQVLKLISQDLDSSLLSWEYFQELFNSSNDEVIQRGLCIFFSIFIRCGYYIGIYSEIVDTFKHLYLKLAYQLQWAFSNSYLPHHLIIFKKAHKRSGVIKESHFCYLHDCTDIYLSSILREFVIQNDSGPRNAYFFLHFQESLEGYNIKKISDFNTETFKTQYYFYKNQEKNSAKSLTFLKKFYLMLLNNPEGKNILHWQDGIDKNMLQAVSFNKNYEEGFIPIPLNPFDPVPLIDKWLVMPNGFEKSTTKINSFSYKPIDFSLAKDEDLKNGLKHWFWHTTVSLPVRIDYANIILKFLDFIYFLRNKFYIKKTCSSDIDSISVEEVFSYVQSIKASNKSFQSVNVVKIFLNYLHENNLYSINPSVFKYLVIKNTTVTKSSKDILDENLLRIEAALKENSHNHYVNTLYYIIFHIAIATEFRISQIINLKVDCLVRGVKKDYYLKSNSKVSYGKEIKIPITPYTRRYIETAISFTQNIRKKCQDNTINEHIFIHNYSTFNCKVITVRSFSDYLKRICIKLGIDSFTAQNLRDTYMTKSIEYAIKNNMSDIETRALTVHKKISTTTNHYVAEKIKDYLEATHLVIIGNPTIKGEILTKTDHTYSDLVNEQCGYCSKQSCIKQEDNLDCLMCSGFIATLDRIPFYETKIKKINDEINSAKLSIEKERLTTIKRLYLAYLEKLLTLKELTL